MNKWCAKHHPDVLVRPIIKPGRLNPPSSPRKPPMRKWLVDHLSSSIWIVLALFLAQVRLLLGPFELVGDARIMSMPKWFYLGNCLKNGIYPLWNPFEGFGSPLLSNPQTMHA